MTVIKNSFLITFLQEGLYFTGFNSYAVRQHTWHCCITCTRGPIDSKGLLQLEVVSIENGAHIWTRYSSCHGYTTVPFLLRIRVHTHIATNYITNFLCAWFLAHCWCTHKQWINTDSTMITLYQGIRVVHG